MNDWQHGIPYCVGEYAPKKKSERVFFSEGLAVSQRGTKGLIHERKLNNLVGKMCGARWRPSNPINCATINGLNDGLIRHSKETAA